MNSNYVVKVKILPESNRFKACQTQPSNDLNWRETFIFQNFPAKQAHRMALEIGIWRHEEVPRLTAHKAQPICESLIPLQSARERNIDFWSLKVPVGSGQARRKSLNDLLESAQVRASQIDPCRISSNQNLIGRLPNGRSNSRQSLGGVASSSRATPTGSEQAHLVGGARLRAQPMRRASDETAAGIRSSSSTRVSPAASRRSISVMNVGVGVGESMVGNLASGGHLSGRNSLSGSGRPGSQSNLATGSNRSSTPGACDSPSRRLLLGGSGSNSPAFSGTVLNQPSSATPTTGMTPQGRRSSLVGIKSMAGYKSQKSSQSDASASQDLPHTVSGTPPSLSRRTTQRDLTHQLQRRTSVVQPAGSCSSEGTAGGPSSRRGSSADRISSGMTTPSGPIQRKGSFAAKAFSRFKRTMSMSKAEEPPELAGSSQTPSNRASTNGSSFDSSGSEADAVAEDLGVKRRLAIQPVSVGRLKLSLVLTKGQLEVDVNCAQDLRLDLEEPPLNLYVKIYLKGRTKSNKRKTRLSQACEAPVFKQTIKYDASLIDNKSLEVSIWQKQGGLKGKSPVGFTEIRLNELDLAQSQTSWYHLKPMEFGHSSSIED